MKNIFNKKFKVLYIIAFLTVTILFLSDCTYKLSYIDVGSKLAKYRFYEESIDLYTKYLDENKPESISAYNYRGVSKLILQRRNKAIKDFNRVIELEPDNAIAFLGRGCAYGDKGDYELALKDFNHAEKLLPPEIKYHVYLVRGFTYYKLQEYNLAIENYKKYEEEVTDIPVNPSLLFDLHYDLSFCHLVFGDYDNTRKECLKAEKNIQDSHYKSFKHYILSYRYLLLEDYESALKHINKAIKRVKELPFLYEQKAYIYCHLDSMEKARDNLKNGLGTVKYTEPIDLRIPIFGLFEYTKGNYKRAVDYYSKALEKDLEDAELYSRRGDAYFKLGNKEKAIKNWKKSNEIHPGFPTNHKAREMIGYRDIMKDLNQKYKKLKEEKTSISTDIDTKNHENRSGHKEGKNQKIRKYPEILVKLLTEKSTYFMLRSEVLLPKPLNLLRVQYTTPYPKKLRDLLVEGTVYLNLLIDKEGSVREVVLEESCYPPIDTIAMSKARELKFSPARKYGMPIEMWISFPFTFRARE